MVIQVEQISQEALERHQKIARGLEEYYRSNMTIGLLAEKLNIPLRALIDFMQKYGLPYKGGAGDKEKGIQRVRKMLETGAHNP